MTTTSTTLLKAIGADADSPRWAEFVARYQPVMESFLASRYPDVDAEDVMQETLIVISRKLPNYHYAPDTNGHFRNYLLGILKNKAREHQRRQDKIAAIAEEVSKGIEPPSERDWRMSAYEVALQQLLADPRHSERTRQMFIRTALKGESPVSVAALFGTTRNNVDQTKNRLTAELKELARSLVDGQ